MLQVIQLGDTARRRGKPPVLCDIGDALAIDKDLPIVPQRFKELLAGAHGHPEILPLYRVVRLALATDVFLRAP